jgi:acetyl esterase/lipase
MMNESRGTPSIEVVAAVNPRDPMASPYSASLTRPSGRSLNLDIFPSEGDSARTAVILLHGGGWSRGGRADVHPYAKVLAAAGFTAIAAEYRLLGEAPWPAQILDVKATIRWVRAHAQDLGVDPDKIVAEGFSAGGHLALLAAGTADRDVFGDEAGAAGVSCGLAGVVSFFAPVDLSLRAMPKRAPPTVALLGEHGGEEVAIAASPVTYVADGFPPTFLLSGLADPFLPPEQTLQMFQALTAVGAKVELHLYHDHTHEFARLPSMLSATQAEVALFLRRAVVDPERYRAENLELNPFARGVPG